MSTQLRILLVSRYKYNFESHILPFVYEQGEALQRQGCVVKYFLVKGSYLRAVKELKEEINSCHPDIVHAHYGLSAIPAELQDIAPVVTTFHNGETLNPIVNFATSLMSLRAKHVIYVAPHIRQKLYFKAKECTILPCGIDLPIIIEKQVARQRLGFHPDKKYVLFGGAFENERKNAALLYEALTLLQRDEIVVLDMKGLSREEVIMRMCACDCFCLPSKSEGSPQALKEAMACGLPIVATNVGDIEERIHDLPGCYLARTADSSTIAGLLQQALSFNGRTQGRERIISQGLTNDLVAEKLIHIYNHVLAK